MLVLVLVLCHSGQTFINIMSPPFINVMSLPLYNILLLPPQIGLTKDTLFFVDIFCWDQDEEEMRTNKCSCLRSPWVKVDQKIRTSKCLHHAVSWRVNDFWHQCCKKIIQFHASSQSSVRFVHIHNSQFIALHHKNHKNHRVLHHHSSYQQKMHCLWVHCVSFMSFWMSKLIVIHGWEMMSVKIKPYNL